MSYQVGNPEDRFCRDEAHIMTLYFVISTLLAVIFTFNARVLLRHFELSMYIELH